MPRTTRITMPTRAMCSVGCLCPIFRLPPRSGQRACDRCCQILPRAAMRSDPGCRQDPRSKWGERRVELRYEEGSEERGKQKLPFRCRRTRLHSVALVKNCSQVEVLSIRRRLCPTFRLDFAGPFHRKSACCRVDCCCKGSSLASPHPGRRRGVVSRKQIAGTQLRTLRFGSALWTGCCRLAPLQPLTLDDMRLSEGGRGGSLSLASFEPEFMRPVPPMLPIADSEVRLYDFVFSLPECLALFCSLLIHPSILAPEV